MSRPKRGRCSVRNGLSSRTWSRAGHRDLSERGWKSDQCGEEEVLWGRKWEGVSAAGPPASYTGLGPPLTRFDTHNHLPPDAVLEGVQVLADVDEHAGLDGLRLHCAEEAGKGEVGLGGRARARCSGPNWVSWKQDPLPQAYIPWLPHSRQTYSGL